MVTMLFGTSGIRGVYGENVDLELALKVGCALAQLGDRVVVGYDHRTTSPILAEALSAGACSCGAAVSELGLLPTSVIAWNAKVAGANAVSITASHNPPQYNGIKLHDSTGSGFDQASCNKIEKLLGKAPKYVGWDKMKPINKSDGTTPYLDILMEKFGTGHGLKVVLDCNHGTAGVISPQLISALGCSSIILREKPDGFWVPLKSTPNPYLGDWPEIAALDDVVSEVQQSDSDLGIVHDGDADRIFVVTKEGPVVPDILVAAVAKVMKRDVILSVDSSAIIEKYTKVTQTPVGDVAISNRLRNRPKAWGAEPSGTFIWPEFSLCPDGIFTSALIISMWDQINDELKTIPLLPIKGSGCPAKTKPRS